MVRWNFKDRNPDLVGFLEERLDAYHNGEEKPVLYTDMFLKQDFLINFPSEIYDLSEMSTWVDNETNTQKQRVLRRGIARVISDALNKIFTIEEQKQLSLEETGDMEPYKTCLMWKYTHSVSEESYRGWKHLHFWEEEDFNKTENFQRGAANHTSRLKHKIKE